MFISEQDKETILTRSENLLVPVISEFVTLSKKGSSFVGDCPCCNARNGLEINDNKKVFKCFKCNGIQGKTPKDFLMKAQGMSFPDALIYLAKHIGHILPDKKEPVKKVTAKAKTKRGGKENEESFCSRMLAESGLTYADVTATIFRKDQQATVITSSTFKAGTINSRNEIDLTGDDAIIEYYDLDGYPVKFEVKDAKRQPTGKFKEYCRVRWQYPDEHTDKDGKPQKYKTMYGAGTHIYIPQVIRKMFKDKTPIPMLFVQEGEKKAEKACKHGIHSVAISGIQNIGQDGRLPEDLIRIIQTCDVKEVCFLLDSDWNDISANIKINDQVEKRPRNFFYAVRNFKDYCRSLKSRQLYVEIYFGHVLKNSAGDKGIDDLLVNTLGNNPEELLHDLEELKNTKELLGRYLQLYKITSATDHKLEEYWNLNHPAKFAEAHRAILKDLPEFKIGKHLWKFNEDGQFVSAQALETDEQYWDEDKRQDKSGNEYSVFSFNYNRCFHFLQNRGFGRYRKIDGTIALIHLEPPVVRLVEPIDIRDYVTDFTKSVASEKVLNMLYKGGPQYLGPDKLTNIDYIEPNFETPSRDKQTFYFSDVCWEVTKSEFVELDYTKVTKHIWANQKKTFSVKKADPLFYIEHNSETDKYSCKITETGKKCHYLQFLVNASNFTWRKEKMRAEDIATKGVSDIEISEDDFADNIGHLVSKLAAIGYMMMEGKDRSVSRAVVAMDGKQGEVGTSNGRSGKSILGEGFRQTMQSIYINGKTKDMTTDQFLWNDLVEGVKCCFIDDVRPNFDFEFLFANITGDWKVNYKGGGRATFPFNISPKIYLTTNHALTGDGSSFLDRQWLIAFSDFYNNDHKPIDDFGVMFFDEWGGDQWNLFWNLMAQCIQTYLRFGVVQAPSERLETRKLRQEVGETFILWADEYFSDETHVNARLPRRTYQDSFYEYAPDQRKWATPHAFKKKFVKYCKLKGYLFNPSRYDKLSGQPLYYDKDGNPDLDDKSGGVEYFTIAPIADLPVPVIDNQPNNTTAIDKLKNYEPEDDVQHDLPF